MADNDFNGVVVVSGGASGMCRATALRLAQRGADLVLVDLNALQGLEETVSMLDSHVGTVKTYKVGDLTSEDFVKSVFETATSIGPIIGVANIAE